MIVSCMLKNVIAVTRIYYPNVNSVFIARLAMQVQYIQTLDLFI